MCSDVTKKEKKEGTEQHLQNGQEIFIHGYQE